MSNKPKKDAAKKPKAISFFAGIGGFEIALEKAGYDVVIQSEINKFCKKVLVERFPDAVLLEDILEIKPEQVEGCDIWTAGFPCQDLSHARGMLKREGLKGRRSGLFFELSRLAEALHPETIVFENVQGLITSHKGKDLLAIITTMTELGYTVAWRILNSRYFGSPQSRPRIYIVAMRNKSAGEVLSVLLDAVEHPLVAAPRRGFLTPSSKRKDGAIVPQVAYCLAATSGRHTGTDWSRTYIPYPDTVRRLTPVECEHLQGFPENWTDVDKSASESERYHAIGNAVTVNVAEWVINRIKHHNKTEIGKFSKLFKSSQVVLSDLESREAIRWVQCGVAKGKSVWQIQAPAHPVDIIERELGEIVSKKPGESHYYLSPNAAVGILRRVDSQRRTLFGPLDKTLRRMASS